MKRNDLRRIMQALKKPSKNQIIKIDKSVAKKANLALERMMELGNLPER
jgi:quinolinate synthase